MRRDTLHADFYEVRMDRELYVEVPLHVTGKAAGVELGGTIEILLREIEVRCLPDQIPASVDVDVTAVEIGESLHVSDLTLPEGVESVTDDRLAVVTIIAPEAEEAPAEDEAEAAAPTEEAAAAAPAEKEEKSE